MKDSHFNAILSLFWFGTADHVQTCLQFCPVILFYWSSSVLLPDPTLLSQLSTWRSCSFWFCHVGPACLALPCFFLPRKLLIGGLVLLANFGCVLLLSSFPLLLPALTVGPPLAAPFLSFPVPTWLFPRLVLLCRSCLCWSSLAGSLSLIPAGRFLFRWSSFLVLSLVPCLSFFAVLSCPSVDLVVAVLLQLKLNPSVPLMSCGPKRVTLGCLNASFRH